MNYFLGIDSGSTMCKAALYDGKGIIGEYIGPTTWEPCASARRAMEFLLNRQGVSRDEVFITATGYGRESVDFADKAITEISAHAKGGLLLNRDIQGIIDIGGQDSKVIRIGMGKALSFQMNDKCAAGTGRFLEMACQRMDILMEDLDSYGTEEEAAAINSMCAVFAESEIIGHLAKKTPREEIVKGVIASVASKISNLTGKAGCSKGDVFLMTGGLAQSKLVVKEISRVLESPVITHEKSQLAGAIGAALAGTMLT